MGELTVNMTNPAAGVENQVVLSLIAALNEEGKSRTILDRFSTSEVLARKLSDYREEYPDFRIRPLDMFSEHELVVVRLEIDLDGRSSDGQESEDAVPELLEAIAVCRIRDGLISDMWFELDIVSQLVAACGKPTAPASRVRRDPLADTEASRALILLYLAALNNQHKTAELVQRFAADLTLADQILVFEAAFPGYSLIADDIIAEGDRVAVRFHTRQHHANEFMGIVPTHQNLSITGLVIYRLEAGKIAEHWLQADLWTLLKDLETGEPPPSKRHLIDRRVRRERRKASTIPNTR